MKKVVIVGSSRSDGDTATLTKAMAKACSLNTVSLGML